MFQKAPDHGAQPDDNGDKAERFADYSQWASDMAEAARRPAKTKAASERAPTTPVVKKKLSYLEAREYAGLEQRIAQAEESLRQKRANAEDPAIASDAERLLLAHSELQQAQQHVDDLYERWAELEQKQ